MHHTLRMAAWNAPGWPIGADRLRWIPALEVVPEGAGWTLEQSTTGPLRRDAPRWRPALERIWEGSDPPALPRCRSRVHEDEGPSRWRPSLPGIREESLVQRSDSRRERKAREPVRLALPEELRRAIHEASRTRPGVVVRAVVGEEVPRRNRFACLPIEEGPDSGGELDGEEDARPSGTRAGPGASAGDEQLSEAPGRPPGCCHPARRKRPQDQHGPRTPRSAADDEAWLMRAVPRRRRTESQRVLEAHARFLQIVFRRTQRLERLRAARRGLQPGGAWRAGAMRGLVPVWRPVCRTQCTDGIATEEDFAAQRRRSDRVLAWYRQYGELLRKLLGRTPEVVDLFCGQGGSSEGIRRAGLAPFGVDSTAQPQYERRFGADRFVCGDAYLPSVVRDCFDSHRAVGASASPPCQPYSTVLADESMATSAPGIPQAAALLRELGCPFWVENVLGADAETLPEQLTILRGQMFGLQVDRGRRFWTNFPVHVDAALSEGGARLRQRSCLGQRTRRLC